MNRTEKAERIIEYKILYTALILLIYLICKELPLYMIDVSAYLHQSIDAETLLLQSISGDMHQCSVFALGISPHMISSILVQVLTAFRSSETKAKHSPKKTNDLTLVLMLIIAVLQAFLKVQELKFRVTGDMLFYAQVIAGIQMVAGAMAIMFLASGNKKYGIGGQTAIIFVNVIDGIRVMIQGKEISELLLPLGIALIVMLIMLCMENTEKRIPLQRISIHNIYADKNYLAIKLNPIGVMPAMFSMAFFMIPQLLLSLFIMLFPESEKLLWWQTQMTLTQPVGIVLYLLILYGLTIGFSRVFVNPREMTENFLKSGDSIVGLHAGRDTKRYLSGVITRISIYSATVMSVCMGVPLVLQLTGVLNTSLVSLPSSVMMLTGIFCNLYREYRAIRDLEEYKSFI